MFQPTAYDATQGTRNAVSECLGKLALISHDVIVPRLQANLTSASPFARASAVRPFDISRVHHKSLAVIDICNQVHDYIARSDSRERHCALTAVLRDTPGAIKWVALFIKFASIHVQDPVVDVRRAALVAFHSAVHSRPAIARDLLPCNS